ncbi:hypothetical protein DI09_5p400 [Mitosporidium daphniae]|uniref:Transcription initiation factor TFIID subunit 9 n=1 Tax=Mitosporidium daphniae TaxID=1485682 RepID=A0A098VNR4_9MICR|nr:uncharacterized protein DI09_5p400 [Mitosporidium daphniae]KGG50693.1 hypothetical protein DI09_5p400 [Mitosporidium daphniae]|eukprot:XP_013237120.1 uncharacterized protein DI09_5p400 [Mitosporidium daphniae]
MNPNQPAPSSQSAAPSTGPILPKDAVVLSMMMQTLSIHECEPQVIPLLLEYSYRHITDTLIAASSFAEHCGRSPLTEISLHDIRYAIQSLASRISSSSGGACGVPGIRPSRELLLELATRKNAEPFPMSTQLSDGSSNSIAGRTALRLPPDELCLLGQQSHPMSVNPPLHHINK